MKKLIVGFYHKANRILGSLEKLSERLEGAGNYDDKFHIQFKDEALLDFYYEVEETRNKLEKALETLVKEANLTKDEILYSPKELRVMKVYKDSISSKEKALAYMRKNISKGIGVNWAQEIAELFGIQPNIRKYQGKSIVFVAELLKQCEEAVK